MSEPFDETKGYAYTVDEYVDAPSLFDPAGSPETAAESFAPFYRELRKTVTKPFWDIPDTSRAAFAKQQLKTWTELARKRNPEWIDRYAHILCRLKGPLQQEGDALIFMHPHLSGADVRMSGNEWIVFANHFWSWRQPGYDIAFPLWGQWLALPPEKRTPEHVARITDAWMDMAERELSGIVSPSDVRLMLLNRLYGSLILDIPAKEKTEDPDAVEALASACEAEANRLLS